MVNFLKILHQTSPFSFKKLGYYKYPLYRVVKTQTVAANHIKGIAAVFTEVQTEISGDFAPFVAKRWGAVTEDWADFVLTTNLKLNYDIANEDLNDEILYNSVRYRIIDVRHIDRIAFDDCFTYALRRKKDQAGG